jgi:uncharacterized protein (DUF433 family)
MCVEAGSMQIEDYFEFISKDEIRLRGTRVGIETVLAKYADGSLPEEIALNYPPITLEQVHATITYYLRNQSEIDEYMRRWAARSDVALDRQEKSRSPF